MSTASKAADGRGSQEGEGQKQEADSASMCRTGTARRDGSSDRVAEPRGPAEQCRSRTVARATTETRSMPVQTRGAAGSSSATTKGEFEQGNSLQEGNSEQFVGGTSTGTTISDQEDGDKLKDVGMPCMWESDGDSPRRTRRHVLRVHDVGQQELRRDTWRERPNSMERGASESVAEKAEGRGPIIPGRVARNARGIDGRRGRLDRRRRPPPVESCRPDACMRSHDSFSKDVRLD